MDVTSYLLGKQAGGGTPINNQNKDVTITENGTTTVSADAGYTGLGTVGVTTNVQPDLESKSVTVTENTTTTITPTSGKDGLSSVSVTTNVPTSASDYFKNTINGGMSYLPGWLFTVKTIPGPLTPISRSLEYAFQYYQGTQLPVVNVTSNIITLYQTFSGCTNLDNLDLSNWDTSNVTDFYYTFSNCSNLKNINLSNWNTSKGEVMRSMFSGCSLLETLDISSFDFSSCIYVNGMFNNCAKLTNLIFGTNLGKGYLTTASANYSNYTLDLSACTLLTHDSLMSVINNLYDIATAGVQTQSLVLGATNLAKLSQAEIDIATNKGWTVS